MVALRARAHRRAPRRARGDGCRVTSTRSCRCRPRATSSTRSRTASTRSPTSCDGRAPASPRPSAAPPRSLLRRERARRARQRGQVDLPAHREPRDPHAHRRDPRHRRPARARRRVGRRSRGPRRPASGEQPRAAVARRQRARPLAARGGQDRAHVRAGLARSISSREVVHSLEADARKKRLYLRVESEASRRSSSRRIDCGCDRFSSTSSPTRSSSRRAEASSSRSLRSASMRRRRVIDRRHRLRHRPRPDQRRASVRAVRAGRPVDRARARRHRARAGALVAPRRAARRHADAAPERAGQGQHVPPHARHARPPLTGAADTDGDGFGDGGARRAACSTAFASCSPTTIPTFRLAIGRSLKMEGASVAYACDGREAVEMAHAGDVRRRADGHADAADERLRGGARAARATVAACRSSRSAPTRHRRPARRRSTPGAMPTSASRSSRAISRRRFGSRDRMLLRCWRSKPRERLASSVSRFASGVTTGPRRPSLGHDPSRSISRGQLETRNASRKTLARFSRYCGRLNSPTYTAFPSTWPCIAFITFARDSSAALIAGVAVDGVTSSLMSSAYTSNV